MYSWYFCHNTLYFVGWKRQSLVFSHLHCSDIDVFYLYKIAGITGDARISPFRSNVFKVDVIAK